jgi:hypothetical protein
MEYLSWRIWGMKRRIAAVEAERGDHFGYSHEGDEEGDEGEVDEVDATTLRTLNDLSVRLQHQVRPRVGLVMLPDNLPVPRVNTY